MDFNLYLKQLPKLTSFTIDDSYRELGIFKNKKSFKAENRELFYIMNRSQYGKQLSKQIKYNHSNIRNHNSYLLDAQSKQQKSSNKELQNIRQRIKSLIPKKVIQGNFRIKSETVPIDHKIQEVNKYHINGNRKILLRELLDQNY